LVAAVVGLLVVAARGSRRTPRGHYRIIAHTIYYCLVVDEDAGALVSASDVDRAVGSLGPLEGRIMREAWSGRWGSRFVVRDVAALFPELAYTTVMTTMRRLADKGLLVAEAIVGQKAYNYEVVGSPAEYLATASRQEVAEVVARYGDAALVAFAASLVGLTPEHRRRLDELSSGP